MAIYPLSLSLDPKTRETLVYNADGKLIATLPADKYSRAWPEDADPARVILQLDLLPAEDVEPYLYTESRIAEFSKSKTTKRGTAQRSLGSSEFGICNIQKLTNGNMRLTLTNGTDTAEIFAYTVLHTSSVVVATWTNEESNVVTDTNTLWTSVSPSFDGLQSAWEYAATNLALTNGVGVWVDANISSNARIRFYAAVKQVDSDEDGLTDGTEILLHQTDTSEIDTDCDNLLDGHDITMDNEDSRYELWATVGIVHVDENGLRTFRGEIDAGTDPLDSNSDNDSLPDGWEVQYGLDPLDSTGDNGEDGDPDGDGFTNLQEFQMGGEPNDPDLSPDQLVYHFMNCREGTSSRNGRCSLRVDVQDSSNCGGTNSLAQAKTDTYQVPPLQSSAYLINVTVKGVVEDHNKNFDIVSIITDPFYCAMREEIEFFGGNNNRNECEMVTKTESKFIWFHQNGSVILKYDTLDALFHSNANAEVISASFVEMAPYSNQFFKVDLDVDTDRDGAIHDDLDEEMENAWGLARGALVSPRMQDTFGTNSTQGLAILKIQQPNPILNAKSEKSMRIYLTDNETRQYLWMVNAGGTNISFDGNGYYTLPLWPSNGATFYAASSRSRKYDSGKPVQFNLELDLLISNQVICSDSVQLTVAPLILPPECFPAEKVYSTTNLGISGVTYLNAGASQWAQDIVKFARTQIKSNSNHSVFVMVNNFPTLVGILQYNEGFSGLSWPVGGDGGNIMATPPLIDAPYGKILLGSKKNASYPYWAAQAIQPVVSISTEWLAVGHVDELFMWISNNQVLYADPWVATDLLHTEIAAGRQSGKLWFGLDSSGTNASIAQVVIATNQAGYKLASLPSPGLSASTNNATLVFSGSVFSVGDILRVGNEILSVKSVNGSSVTVARGQAGRPPAAHSPGSAIYAYSDVVRANLPVGSTPDQSVVAKISAASNQLRQALGAYPATFVPMPVLFGELSGPGTYIAFSANVVNCLVGVGGAIHYSYTGCAVFEDHIAEKMPGAQGRNVWAQLHCHEGEIHCATAATRSIPPQPPWWNQINNWE